MGMKETARPSSKLDVMPRHLLAVALAVLALTTVPASAEPTYTVEDDIIVESADGTPIVATLMLPTGASSTSQVPAVIGTHGWAGSRSRSPSGLTARLIDRG
jgi:hypothetical protein